MPTPHRLNLFIAIGLITAVWLVYGDTLGFAFVEFDDTGYVTANDHVKAGLTGRGVAWALTSGDMSNWHPLTWLSHMLDWQLFGANAGGHHAINVVLHSVNTLVLFGLLLGMTHRQWPSAIVAALFALHPLHVESVAWVSQRKDLLSTLAGLGSIWAYVAYVRTNRWRWYAASAGLLMVSLTAKPMFVTLPFVLLLLDVWPLERTSGFRRRLIEKLPLFAIVSASCLITLLVQRQGGAVRSMYAVSWWQRLGNALATWWTQLVQTVWPADLCVLYPHPYLPGGGGLSAGLIISAAVMLTAITAAALAARRHRFLLVGWLWYVGTLVPVIGLVQVGQQAMADRYTYVPLIGLFIAGVWSIDAVLARLGSRMTIRPIAAAAGGVVVVALALGAHRQVQTWRNSYSLFANALSGAPNNPVIHNNLGLVLQRDNRLEEAMLHYGAAVEQAPAFYMAQYNLANTLAGAGNFAAAIVHYEKAVALKGDYPQAHVNLGIALATTGRTDDAIRHYRLALRYDPTYAIAHNNLGHVLATRRAMAEAIFHFRRALEIDPGLRAASTNLANALAVRRASAR